MALKAITRIIANYRKKLAGKAEHGQPSPSAAAPLDLFIDLLDMSDTAVRKMITHAKQRGNVTYDELNRVLPLGKASSEQVEETMALLNEMGITVIDMPAAKEALPDMALLEVWGTAVDEMITRGKQRGYVTYDELNRVLPPDKVSSVQIEETMSLLNENGLNIEENERGQQGPQQVAAERFAAVAQIENFIRKDMGVGALRQIVGQRWFEQCEKEARLRTERGQPTDVIKVVIELWYEPEVEFQEAAERGQQSPQQVAAFAAVAQIENFIRKDMGVGALRRIVGQRWFEQCEEEARLRTERGQPTDVIKVVIELWYEPEVEFQEEEGYDPPEMTEDELAEILARVCHRPVSAARKSIEDLRNGASRETTTREPKENSDDVSLTPEQVAAELARLKRDAVVVRYEVLLKMKLSSPEDRLTREEALLLGDLAEAFRTLNKRRKKEGLKRLEKPRQVKEAERLKRAFYASTPELPKRRNRGAKPSARASRHREPA